MGCVCCSVSSFVSILLDALERISLCTVCALLTCCLLFTIITVMVIGVGIGYHYCFVQNSVDAMAKAAKAAGALRSGEEQPGPVMRSMNRVMKRSEQHSVARRDIDQLTPESNSRPNGTFPVANTNGTGDFHQIIAAVLRNSSVLNVTEESG